MTTDSKIYYEFGPFRMDPDKQVLLRENVPVPITPRAFETLLVLVRRNGEVVSKEELLKSIWPDSFVEESNLSQNVFMLRRALGDTPEDRNYIVTLPGRGYRFAAEVRTISHGAEALVAQKLSRTQIVIEQDEPEPAQLVNAVPLPARQKMLWRYRWAAGAILVILSLGALLLVRNRHQPVALGAKDSVTKPA